LFIRATVLAHHILIDFKPCG